MSDKKKTALTVRIDEDLSQAFKRLVMTRATARVSLFELIKKWLSEKNKGIYFVDCKVLFKTFFNLIIDKF